MALEQVTVEYNLALGKAKAQFEEFVSKLLAKEAEIKEANKTTATSIILDLSKIVKARKDAANQAIADSKKSESAIVEASKQTTTKIVAEENKREAKHKEVESKKVVATKKAEATIVATINKTISTIISNSKKVLSAEAIAANKRAKFIRDEIEDLEELRKRKKLAYTPEEISQYNKRIAETQQRIKTLKDETGNLSKGNGNLVSSFKSIAAAIGLTFSVQQLIGFGKELLEIERKSKTVTKAFNNLASTQDLAALRASTGFGVSDLQLKALTVRAAAFKIPLETLPKLLKFATIRAAETGQEVDYLVESIINGIGRKSALVIDNLGISVSETQKEFKKTGDFAVAVGNIIEREMDKSVTSIDDAIGQTQKLSASWENFKENLSKSVAPALNQQLGAINSFLKARNEAVEAQTTTTTDELKLALDVFTDYGDSFIKVYTDKLEAGLTIDASVLKNVTLLRDLLNTSADQYKALREEVGNFTEYDQFNAKIEEITNLMKPFEEQGVTASKGYLSLATSLKLVQQSMEQLGVKIAPTGETLKQLNEELTLLKDQFENTDVNTTLFRTIQQQIKDLEARIESIVNPTNKGSIAYFEAQLAKLEERLKKETSITRIRELEREIYLLGVRIAAIKNLDTVLGDELISESVPADLDAANKAAIHLLESLQLLNDTQLKELNKELEKTSKELTDLATQVTDDLWEEFKANIDAARQKQEEFNAILTSSITNVIGDLTGLFNSIGEQQDEAINRQLEGERQRAQEHFDIMRGIWQSQLDNGQITKEELFNQETAYNEKINALEARQAELRKQQLRKQAIAEKANASFQLIVGTTTAVAKNLANPPAIIAIIAAAAAQLAILAATPIPEFATGVVGLQGAGTETSDSIHAKLSKGESVITAKATRQNKDALTAMNKGEYEKYVQQTYIMPALEVKRQQQRNSFAESIATSMQSGTYDDSLLIHETRKNKAVNIKNADQIGKATAREMSRNSYFRNRV